MTLAFFIDYGLLSTLSVQGMVDKKETEAKHSLSSYLIVVNFQVVGNLIYYRYMNPAIVAPDAFDIVSFGVDKGLTPDQVHLIHLSLNPSSLSSSVLAVSRIDPVNYLVASKFKVPFSPL